MTKTLLLATVALCMCSNTYAQLNSLTPFYQQEMIQATVEPLPGTGEYVLTETMYRSSADQDDNSIHFRHYKQDGTQVDDIIIDESGVDDRNVDIVSLGGNQFAIVAYYSPLGSGRTFVNTMLVDQSGNIMQQMILESTDPIYRNLRALDAVFDPNSNQIVICGMATNDFGYDVGAYKAAFVATLDPNTLATTNMMFYDSNPGLGSSDDYDIANRVVLSNYTGGYYITGSENIDKYGVHMMGIRNMLIDPSLNIMWSTPLHFKDPQSHESSVDMVEYPMPSGTSAFYTLVNSTFKNRWWLIRIDAGSGLPADPSNPIVEGQFSYYGYGHNIALGNNPWELVVSGMKPRNYNGDCTSQDQEATPFMSTLNVSTTLATMPIQTEYYTIYGNSSYWTSYGFYSTLNGYPVPSYLNNFADREGQGFPYSVVAPLYNNNQQLNTKYIDVDLNTRNGCKDLYCHLGIDFNTSFLDTYPMLTNSPAPWNNYNPNEQPYPINPYDVVDCHGYQYYRNDNTTGVQNLSKDNLSIYPNPATDKLSVDLGGSYKEAQITLYDMAGKRIAVLHNGAVNTGTLQLTLPTNIATGIYMLQVSANGHTTITERITVNK